MPTTASSLLLGGVAIIAMLSAGFSALMSRHALHAKREREMREAIDLLRLHYDAMGRMDDEATPEGILEFALKLSRMLHDPTVRESTIRVLREGIDSADDHSPDVIKGTDIVYEEYKILLRMRPDLATAFIQSIVSGILAFEKRWPECAGILSSHVTRVVASPVEEAQRIVRAADRATGLWSVPPIDAVAA